MTFTHGWLSSAQQVPTRRFAPLVDGPLCLVWHTTDTAPGADMRAMCERVQRPPVPGQRAVSWHLLIARTGTIYQLAPISVATWHCGKGGIVGGRRVTSINVVSVGIELENGGRLREAGGGYYADTPWKDGDESLGLEPRNLIDPAEVEQVGHSCWHRFTGAQVSAAGDLLAALHVALPKIPSREMQRTHHEFDPDRKDDPGPLWTDQILPGLVGRALASGGTP